MTHDPALATGSRVCVLGADPAGFACADALLERGLQVWMVEDPQPPPGRRERLVILETLGAVLLAPDAALPDGLDLVVVPRAARSVPALAGAHAVLDAASRADGGPPTWDETEVAWRLRPEAPAPWLLIAGTAGTDRLARLTAAMLTAGGLRALVAGGPDDPVVESVLHPQPPDVLVVDLGADGPGPVHTAVPLASVLYGEGPGEVYEGTGLACVYDAGDPHSESAVADADVQEGCRAIGVTRGVPAPSFLGLVDDVLCDRAYVPNRSTSAAELCTLADVAAAVGGEVGPGHVITVLTAAALARAAGVSPGAVRRGLLGAEGVFG